MKIFLSYSTIDKSIAGKIKNCLDELLGVEAFLAHDDIDPDDEWLSIIESELKTCHVLVAIMTRDFYYSDWTNQEVGFALGRDIPVISIDAGESPRGFTRKKQAIKFDEDEIDSTSIQIAKIIASKPKLREDFLDRLIEKFGNSGSRDIIDRRSKALDACKEFYTNKQKNEILKMALSIDGINRAFDAAGILRKFIRDFKDELDVSLVKECSKKIEPPRPPAPSPY